MLPSENHTLIIQTFAEKEAEPCEIKINVTRGRKKKNILRIQYILIKKTDERKGHNVYDKKCCTIVAIVIILALQNNRIHLGHKTRPIIT